ncbi:hypothetical protein L596_018433 [Steinernema carpocapsae]|uniref:Uncharacterized protein n=1 Tax=Steinernema carpocapsae TaxID=34508 RepID=A0A4U5N5C2_STECR|nr:hypothetical protein L596_018433 [Steinernema carpocapsae]
MANKSEDRSAERTQRSKESQRSGEHPTQHSGSKSEKSAGKQSPRSRNTSASTGLPKHRELDHDKTQWENTRFKELHANLLKGIDPNEQPISSTDTDAGTLKPELKAMGTGTFVPGESRQKTRDIGEHLMLFPTFSVILACVEMGCLALAFILTGVASKMVILGGWVVLANILVCMILLAFVLFIQSTRRHVNQEKTPELHKVFKTDPRYKKIFFSLHIIRLFLSISSAVILFYICSCEKISSIAEEGSKCRQSESLMGLYITAGVVMLFPIAFVIAHLVFIVKNQFARKALC